MGLTPGLAMLAACLVLLMSTAGSAQGTGTGTEATSRFTPDTFDPLKFSTYVGGTDVDWAHSIAIDQNGSYIVAGYTNSQDFPTTQGAYSRAHAGNEDVYVLKLSSDGRTLEWSTLIGGTGQDIPWDIDVGPDGEVYVTGHTTSDLFPTTQGAFSRDLNGDQDAFVLCLSSDGSTLHYSTYLGGEGDDKGTSVIALPDGSVIVGGQTESFTFPTTSGAYDRTLNGFYDVFVSKLSWDGKTLKASTYLGGSYTEKEPKMALDGFGNIWLAGSTSSLDFPTSPGVFQDQAKIGLDIFVTAMSPDLDGIGVSTLVGEDGNDVPRSIDIGPRGELLVAGFTTSLTFPDPSDPPVLVNSGETDGFLLVLQSDLRTLTSSILVGGGNFDVVRTALFDGRGNIHVTGYTNSTDLPVTPDAYKAWKTGDDHDMFYIRSNATDLGGTYSSYLGSAMGDFGMELALDAYGLPVLVGHSRSDTFPVTPNTYDGSYNGAGDIVVLCLTLDRDPPRTDEEAPPAQVPVDLLLYVGANVTDATGVARVQVEFQFDDGEPFLQDAEPYGIRYIAIAIVPDTVRMVHYYFIAYDVLGQVAYGEPWTVVVPDWLRPEVVEDLTVEEGTTGDPLELRVQLRDNRAVHTAQAEYFIDDELVVEDMQLESGSPGIWTHVVDLPETSTAPFRYRFNLSDMAGNFNVSTWDQVAVLDNDAPVLDGPELPEVAMPGSIVTIQVNASDNIAMVSARLEYYEGSGQAQVIEVPTPIGTRIVVDVIMPDGRGDLLFTLYAEDGAGNEASVSGVISFRDFRPPRIIRTVYADAATTGDPFLVEWVVEDETMVSQMWVYYMFGEGPRQDYNYLQAAETYAATLEIPVPPDEWEPLFVIFGARDTSGNVNETEAIRIEVVDNDPPVVIAGPDGSYLEDETIVVSSKGSWDNIGIVSYKWSWRRVSTSDWDELEATNGKVTLSFGPGEYVVELRAFDAAGNEGVGLINITVREQKDDEGSQGPSFYYLVVIAVVAALVVVVALLNIRSRDRI